MGKIAVSTEDINHEGTFRRRMINMYAEPTPAGPEKFTDFPRPGLVQSFAVGSGPVRTSFLWKAHRVIVSGTDVFFDGVSVGNIPGTDLCRFAVSDDQIVIVANGQAWLITASAVAVISDADLLPNVVDVIFLSGRFVYMNGDSTEFQWSDLGDATSIDGLSFAEADENSSQMLRAGFVLVDDLAFFMNDVVEWWTSNSDPANPYIRSPGRKYNKGILARATTVLLDNTVFWLGSDKKIYRASAIPVRVSNYTVENYIGQVEEANLSTCSAFGVSFGGHDFYVITLTGVGTWALDIGTNKWVEWSTWGQDRFRVNVADEDLLGDAFSGAMFTFDASTFSDAGDPMVRIIHAYSPLTAGFLRNFNLYLKCTRGVGLTVGQGSAPVVEMRFSDDDGTVWSPWMEASLGVQGDRSDTAKAIWDSLGSIVAPGRLYEFRCTDPVFFNPSSVFYNEVRP